ncbi:hypothetical protein ABT160_38590 [Streptomyces sp. NPDC001941]|uniref:hypothetical protein n=1 Tax=Streptomyces sp. NPDC001941 TaxID=3154659 RepID=UPI0033248205
MRRVPPRATTSRFALLATTVFVASFVLHNNTVLLLRPLVTTSALEQRTACADRALAGAATLAPLDVTLRFRGCLHSAILTAVWAALALVAVTFVVAFGLYALHPRLARTGPTKGLADLEADPGTAAPAGVVRAVMAQDAPTRAVVTVRFTALPHAPAGRCLGFPGRYLVVLNLGLAAADPRLLPAALRHELAHLRGRDVGLTQLTIALWWAFLATVAVPAVALALVLGEGGLGQLLTEAGVALAALWCERAAVLRARELQADEAVRHPDYTPVLALLARAEEQARERMPKARRRWERAGTWLTYHPGWALRADRRAHPDRPRPPSLFECAAAGLLVGLSYRPVEFTATNLWPTRPATVAWGVGAAYGVLVSAVLTLAVWRSVWRTPRAPGPAVRSLPPALACACGLLAGEVLQPLGLWRALAARAPWVAVAWVLLALSLLWAFVAWQALLARWWRAAGVPPRAGALVASLVVGTVLLGYFLGTVFADRDTLLTASDPVAALGAVVLKRLTAPADAMMVAGAALVAVLPGVVARLRGRGGAVGARVVVPRLWVVLPAGVGAALLFLAAASPLHRSLRAGLDRVAAAPVPTVPQQERAADFAPLVPTTLVGAGCVAAGALAVALSARGAAAPYRRARELFPVLVLGGLVAALLAAPVMLLHIELSVCGWRDLSRCASTPPPLPYTMANGRWMLMAVLGPAGVRGRSPAAGAAFACRDGRARGPGRGRRPARRGRRRVPRLGRFSGRARPEGRRDTAGSAGAGAGDPPRHGPRGAGVRSGPVERRLPEPRPGDELRHGLLAGPERRAAGRERRPRPHGDRDGGPRRAAAALGPAGRGRPVGRLRVLHLPDARGAPVTTHSPATARTGRQRPRSRALSVAADTVYGVTRSFRLWSRS